MILCNYLKPVILSVSILVLKLGFVRSQDGRYEVNTEFDNLGCFAFNEKHTSPLFEDDIFVTLTEENYIWQGEDCATSCTSLEHYTYAGVPSYDPSVCLCFNNLRKMTKVEDAGCVCVRKAGGMVCPNEFQTLTAFTTCPVGFFHPPSCQSRARETCQYSTRGLGAGVYHDGMCEVCTLEPGQTGYEKCEVFSDKCFIMDLHNPSAPSPRIWAAHVTNERSVVMSTAQDYIRGAEGINIAQV